MAEITNTLSLGPPDVYFGTMSKARRSRFEDHWPWYFRLFVNVLDERSRWVIAPESPWRSYTCRPFEGPDEHVREFVAATAPSAWGLRRFRLKHYPIRSESQIFDFYRQAFERAFEVYRYTPQQDGRVHVLLLRAAEYGDSAIIVTAFGQTLEQSESGERIVRTADCRTRIDFRRMKDGAIRVSEWAPRGENSTKSGAGMLEEMRR